MVTYSMNDNTNAGTAGVYAPHNMVTYSMPH